MTDEQITKLWNKHSHTLGGWDYGGTEVMYEGGFEESARAIEAEATAPLLERIAQKQARIDQLIQEVAAGADVEAAQRERIAALEAKLAQRVPEGWKLVPVKPTDTMAFAADEHCSAGTAKRCYLAMLAASPRTSP